MRGRGNRRKKRLIARARWEREIGWDYIKSIADSGREVHPDDLPPRLGWEGEVWELYAMVCTQWRYKHTITGYTGAGMPIMADTLSGLDYNPAIALMQHYGWPLDMGLKLLKVIEQEMLRPAEPGMD